MVDILISEITVKAKKRPHDLVLTGESGHLIEDEFGPPSVTIHSQNAVTLNDGPIENDLYKIRFNVAGEFENVRNIKYIGFSTVFNRYVFSY